ncbi:MAG TPA: acylphosphatase [Ginsengibacter sp.]
MKTIHLEISGKVQGVFFRSSAKEIAELYEISGWIRNTCDDKVEVLITGREEDVQKFIEWCNEGPDKAKVEHVAIANAELQTFNRFEVIR